MHSLRHPTARTWYICTDTEGNVVAYDYVDPDQTMDSGADTLETYATETTWLVALATHGIAPVESTPATPG